jgi:hypothetical protein
MTNQTAPTPIGEIGIENHELARVYIETEQPLWQGTVCAAFYEWPDEKPDNGTVYPQYVAMMSPNKARQLGEMLIHAAEHGDTVENSIYRP